MIELYADKDLLKRQGKSAFRELDDPNRVVGVIVVTESIMDQLLRVPKAILHLDH